MRVSFFGSSYAFNDSDEYRAAHDSAYELALAGYTIVNGGGAGIMEASTQGAREAGGKSIGVVIKNRAIDNASITSFNDEIIVLDTLFARIKELVVNSSAWVVFPGGTGTLAELAMAWDLVNKGLLNARPIVIYGQYWNPLVDLISGDSRYDRRGSCADLVTVAHSACGIVTAVKEVE
jgi:uncharacterized protein (TIGR00730 family)